MSRGQLTKEVKKIAKKQLGRKITQTELRLMPYIQYTLMNNQKIDPRKINQDDRIILALWKEQGHIQGGMCGLSITKEFWNIINEILWQAYIVQGAEDYNRQDAVDLAGAIEGDF